VEAITTDLEPDLVYPLLRGRDVQRWQAQPSLHILLPHTLATLWQAISEKEMQQLLPKTWAYLSRFRDVLLQRSGYRLLRFGHPFYILGNVNESTFARWKVVWRGEVATSLVAAVVGDSTDKFIVPDQTAYLVAFDNQDAAHFLCGMLNSTIVQLIYAMHTYKHVSMSFIQSILVPQYNPQDLVHKKISQLSQRAHALAPAASSGDQAARAQLQQVEAEIDRAAARLWGLTDAELQEIQVSLKELKE
jgi:hypothetical protein